VVYEPVDVIFPPSINVGNNTDYFNSIIFLIILFKSSTCPLTAAPALSYSVPSYPTLISINSASPVVLPYSN